MDWLEVVVPALTALVGAYAGARFQSRGDAERELRELLDQGSDRLVQVNLLLNIAISNYRRESLNTTPGSREHLALLDAERVRAEQVCDRIMSRTEPKAAVYEHFVAALRAAEKARDKLIWVAFLNPQAEGNVYEAGKHPEQVDAARDKFNSERYAFLGAVQRRTATPWHRRWSQRGPKPSEPERTEET